LARIDNIGSGFDAVAQKRRCFTTIQLAVTLGIMLVLAAIIFPVYNRARNEAYRVKCDTNLKVIAFALDTYKQENGYYPATLTDLVDKGFITDPSVMHCPCDPRPNGTYADFYVLRSPQDDDELPVLVCPFHEEDTGHGGQARLGRFTTQFATRPAELTAANDVQIFHPDDENGVPGYAGMVLHGGDRITTGNFGRALVTFADGSDIAIQGNSDITVLQSFLDGEIGGVLYTLVHESSGDATYTVHHGSRFDVSTPAATAGARGTRFRVIVNGTSSTGTQLYVFSGTVAFTNTVKTGVAPVGQWISAAAILSLLRSIL